MTSSSTHNPRIPSKVQRWTKSNCLHLDYGYYQVNLKAELLRVLSPSAEVRQHGNPILVAGKSAVMLKQVELIGQYGLKLSFDDGHDTGIYTWAYLEDLSQNQERLWEEYCERLHQNDRSRHADEQVVQLQPATSSTQSSRDA